jgi:1-acyl-sn-glycerol-3-phosphate acyltransferase
MLNFPLRSFLIVALAALWTVALMPLACLVMLLTLNPSTSIGLARKIWAPGLLWLGGATVSVVGREYVDPRKPAIYVSNHQSTIDIPLLFTAIPSDVRFMAKKSVRYIPVLGWYMWLAGYVFVDRGKPRKAIASLERAAQKIHGGTSIIVFAEGTRSTSGVLPFKKGPFALALKAKVPIYPIAIEGTGKLLPKGRWRITPGIVRVKIGRPIPVESYGQRDRQGLMLEVREAIVRQHLELRKIG